MEIGDKLDGAAVALCVGDTLHIKVIGEYNDVCKGREPYRLAGAAVVGRVAKLEGPRIEVEAVSPLFTGDEGSTYDLLYDGGPGAPFWVMDTRDLLEFLVQVSLGSEEGAPIAYAGE